MSPLLLVLALLAPASPAAPGPSPTSAVASPAPDAAARAGDATPRATLQTWLDLEREGRHVEAAEKIELPLELSSRGPELSLRLKAVLDRHLWFDMNAVSDAPEGSAEEGLPADVESLGSVPGPSGQERVLLIRLPDGKWRFSSSTAGRIDEWFSALPNRWTVTLLPNALLRPGPKELLWWQWLALPVLVLLAAAGGRIAARLTRAVLTRAARRTSASWDDAILGLSAGPLALAWGAGIAWVLVPFLDLYLPAQEFLHSILSTVLYASVFWLALRGVDIAGARVASTQWAIERKLSSSLVPLGTRSGKVLIAAIGAIAVLSSLGYPVASLLAGLGIGGLAVALAAQKTVENVFGAFSIGVDQPFREGDFVKIEDFVGTVEKIGLRSTRIRTLDRTVISVPNGKLADMRLETFAARDRIRLFCVLGLVYGTSSTQMREVLAELEKVLRAHPRIWPDAVVVRFVSFGPSSLDVEIMAWFQTSDWNEFTAIRQEMFLEFMRVVERAGSSFAFPTRTIHLVSSEGERKSLAG